MKRQLTLGVALLALSIGGSCLAAESPRIVAIHAGQMFDSKAERISSKQVIVIQGQRIADVGPEGSVKVPPRAEEIDLSAATVLPGLIDSHNHQFKIADHPGADSGASMPAEIKPGSVFSPGYVTILAAKNAKLDLESGFTTTRDLSSGGTLDVDLRNAINEGLVPGPRMVIATEGMRGSIAGPRYFHLIDSPWEGRKQVRVQLKNGADFIKIYAAGVRANPAMGYGPPTMTAEEENAIVDEAHRRGVKVACTAHAGIAVRQSILAGCDSIELNTDIDEESVRMVVEKGTFMTFGLTITKIGFPAARLFSGGDFPMVEMSKASFQRALKAGVKIAFAVNATGAHGKQPGPYHGEGAVEFASMVEYGMTPLQALRSATVVGADNIGWGDRVGAIERGKFADIIAVSGNPAVDVTEMERVKFVMKGGQVVRNDLKGPAAISQK